MKKRLMIIVTIIMYILCTRDVNAENAWPQSFSYNSYNYTIEKVSLYVYEYDEDSPEITDENGVTSKEDSQRYMSENQTTIIDLGAEDYTISPEAKESSIQGMPAILIDLNLNLTTDSLKKLLASQMTIVEQNEKKSYMVDLVVEYTFTSYPENFHYAYKSSVLRSIFNSFMGVANSNGIVLSNKNTQVLNTILVDRNSETGEAYLYYEDQYTNDNGVGLFALNFTVLTEEEYTNLSEAPSSTSQVIMFHNLNNIDDLIGDINKIRKSDLPETFPEQVRVPSTAQNSSKSSTLFGVIFMMFGTLLVSKVLLKNN